ncbi:MAG: chemotaxis protein CheW [Nodosilinea sp.]
MTTAPPPKETDLSTDLAGLAPEATFLQITLDGDLPLLLPGTNLVEIMKLPLGQVVPMFQMPPWVVGLYNWRGDLLWVADGGHFVGLAPWYRQAEAATRHTVVVIKPPYVAPEGANQLVDESPLTLGLVVSAVDAMVTYPAAALQPVPDLGALPETSAARLTPDLLPLLQGCCMDSSGQPQLILNGTAMLTAMAQTQA